jgi:hypothetical protein
MQVITEKISLSDLKTMSTKMYNHLVKAVVDIEKNIMVVDADLHADEEELLLEGGSEQQNLWGINIHPEKIGFEDFIEFDSMINIRPSWGNRSRGVEDLAIQKKIVEVVNKLVAL